MNEAPKGGQILSLKAYHPEAAKIKSIVQGLNLDIEVQESPKPLLVCHILSDAKGIVELS